MKRILFAIAAIICALTVNAKGYKVGDYYEEGNVKGIVVRVDATGEHGLIMSLDKCAKKWINEGDEKFSTNAFFEDDGEKNMAVIEKYIKENGKSWEMFPYFEWCRSLGEGWYAPALDELKDILKAINGGEGKYDAKYMKVITKTLKKHKGDGLINSGFGGSDAPQWMYSSTESGDAGMIYVMMFQESTSSSITRGLVGGGVVGAFAKPKPKGDFKIMSYGKTLTGGKFAGLFGSRAVHKF